MSYNELQIFLTRRFDEAVFQVPVHGHEQKNIQEKDDAS